MILTVHKHLEQGSDEWLAARCGLVTASIVGQLITPTLKVASNDTSRALTMNLAAERITGHVEEGRTSFDMERGTWDEPYARATYADHYAPVDEVGFMVREIEGVRIGYSPDGLVGDSGLIEIKSRLQKKHLDTIISNAVPAENMAQLQTGLLVSGRDWIDYLSYCGGMPLYRLRVLPDPAWQEAIIAAVKNLEANAEDIITRYRAATEGLPTTERINHFPELEIKF